MTRVLFALAALALAACSETSAPGASGKSYTLDVRASESAQIFAVTGPDGAVVAGKSENGVSTLLDASESKLALAELQPAAAAEAGKDGVSFKAPGISFSAGGDGEGAEGSGSVKLSIGGTELNVSGAEGAANVHIAGVDAEAVRQFIVEADELSPEVQAQMLKRLGIE